MLRGFDLIPNPGLLENLRVMGSETATVDGNYPAQRIVRADGPRLVQVLNTILSVLPSDTDTGRSAMRTADSNTPQTNDTLHICGKVSSPLLADQVSAKPDVYSG